MLSQDKHNHRHFQSMIVCLLPLLLTTGCYVIAIPVPTGEEPYYTGAIPMLNVGTTSKNEVLTEFGVPDRTYNQGSELVYVETQESWKVPWAYGYAVPGDSPFNSDADAGVKTLHKRFVLLVSFNNHGVLSDFEAETAGDDFGDCTRSGICFGMSNSIMRYAEAATDSMAKEFHAAEDQCSIYLHGPGNKKVYEVSLNGKIPVNMFSTNAFIHWLTTPGLQNIVTYPESTFLDFDCQGGDLIFVHFDYRWTGPSKMQIEDQETGRDHISKHRLILLPTR